MKVALTVWENRISPMFDCARMLLIATIENQKVTHTRYEPLPSKHPTAKAKVLFDLDINVLICGAISNFFANMIEAYGIRIVSFITGEVRQVLDVYAKGLLPHSSFQMPGVEGRKLDHHRSSKKRKKTKKLIGSKKTHEGPLSMNRGR